MTLFLQSRPAQLHVENVVTRSSFAFGSSDSISGLSCSRFLFLTGNFEFTGRGPGSFHYLRGGRGSIPEIILKTLITSLSRGSAATSFCCSSPTSGVG